MRSFSIRFLVIYSAVLTLVFAVTVFSGFAAATRANGFDEIKVHRINVVEPHGRLRLVISNRSSLTRAGYGGRTASLPPQSKPHTIASVRFHCAVYSGVHREPLSYNGSCKKRIRRGTPHSLRSDANLRAG